VVTDEQGRFRLTGLPAGSSTIKAWVDSRTTKEQPAELKAGSTAQINFP
jgi:hypothetical protein